MATAQSGVSFRSSRAYWLCRCPHWLCFFAALAIGQPPAVDSSLAPPVSSRQEDDLRALLTSVAGGRVSDSIRLHRFPPPEGGLGVRAARDIPRGTELVRVPPRLQLASSGSPPCEFRDHEEWRGRLSNAGFVSLCLFLLLRHGDDEDGGTRLSISNRDDVRAGTEYLPYLTLLPEAVPNAVHYGRGDALLSGYRPFVEWSMGLSEDMDEFLMAVRSGCSNSTSLGDCLGIGDTATDRVVDGLRWSFSIAMSRGYFRGKLNMVDVDGATKSVEDVPPDVLESLTHVLSPYDFFNHGPSNNVKFTFTSDGTLVFLTVRSVAKDEQLFVSYGPVSNTILASQYGFVLENNEYDTLRISFGPDADDPNHYLKRLILEQVMKFHWGTLRRGLGGGILSSPDTFAALRLVTTLPEELTARNVGRILDGRSIGRENDVDALWLMLDSCRAQVKALAPVPAPLGDGMESITSESSREEAREIIRRYRSKIMTFAEDCVRSLERILITFQQQ